MPEIGVPDVAVRTTGADTRRKVMLSLSVALMVRTLAQLDRKKGTYTPGTVFDALLQTNIPAWVVLYFALAVASDFDTTRELAIAFAILILVSVLLYDGPDALKRIEGFTSPKTKKSTKKGAKT